MGLEKVKKDIMEKANKKAEKILDEARKEAESIKQKAKVKVMESRRRSKADILKLCATMEKKELSASEFDAKKAYLDRKKKMIDVVFENSMNSLLAMRPAEKKDIIKRLLKMASSKIEIGKVYTNKSDKGLVPDYPVGTGNMRGGIIVENKEKNVTIDLTYGTLLADIREKQIQKIAELLFL